MTKPLYFYNGTTFELVGPTTPQSPIAYQTSAPTAPATGDLWIDSDGDVDTYNRQLTRYYFVATASQTTITGTDANGLTLAYVAGSEQVYVNGALQVRGQDYTATNGTSVVMSTALAVNDVVEIFAYTAFTVANAYTKSETDGLVGAAAGLKLLTPTSIAIGSGTGSVNVNGSVTFSGASSVSLNGVFSSTYDNYKILFNHSVSAAAGIRMRLRVSGSDDTNNVYGTGMYYRQQGGASVGNLSDGFTQSFALINDTNSLKGDVSLDLYNPFTVNETRLTHQTNWQGYSPLQYYTNMGGGVFTNTTSFTGFTILTSSNTMTGTVAVYGYKD